MPWNAKTEALYKSEDDMNRLEEIGETLTEWERKRWMAWGMPTDEYGLLDAVSPTTREAAEIIGCTSRNVRRLVAERTLSSWTDHAGCVRLYYTEVLQYATRPKTRGRNRTNEQKRAPRRRRK